LESAADRLKALYEQRVGPVDAAARKRAQETDGSDGQYWSTSVLLSHVVPPAACSWLAGCAVRRPPLTAHRSLLLLLSLPVTRTTASTPP
jgi:hypothetical protein